MNISDLIVSIFLLFEENQHIFYRNYYFLVPIFSNPEVDLESQAASLDHIVPPFRLIESGNGSNGFTLVGGEPGETGSLSHHMKV